MKTDPISVEQKRMSELLDKVSLFAQYAGMTRRDSNNMSLLTEEMILSVRNILDACEGVVWFETDEKTFSIHLQIEAFVDEAQRKKFLAISKSGENKKPTGFLARAGMALDNWLFAIGESPADVYMSMSDPTGMMGAAPAGFWSLSYHDYVKSEQTRKKAEPKAPDELEGIEKAIIERIADDITVSVRNSVIDIVAVKTFA